MCLRWLYNNDKLVKGNPKIPQSNVINYSWRFQTFTENSWLFWFSSCLQGKKQRRRQKVEGGNQFGSGPMENQKNKGWISNRILP